MPGGFPLGLDICNGNDVGSNTAASQGTQVNAAGTANTYGSFTALNVATAFDACWMSLSIVPINGQCSVRIAIGSSGSEQTIIADLMAPGDSSSGVMLPVHYTIPVSIPAGTRISAAVQSISTIGHCFINMRLFDGAFTQMEGYSLVDSIGFVPSSTLGTTVTSSSSANTKGSYAAFTVASPRDYAALFFAVDSLNAATAPTGSALLDIAIGASGSELVIIPNVLLYAPISGSGLLPVTSGLFPIAIKAGTRIAARVASSQASATSIGLTIYGVAQ